MRRRPSLLSPTAYVRRRAIYDGLLGGQRGWLAVGRVLWGARLLRNAVGRSEQVVATEVLRPGETVTVVAIKAPSRSERKAAKRSN